MSCCELMFGPCTALSAIEYPSISMLSCMLGIGSLARPDALGGRVPKKRGG